MDDLIEGMICLTNGSHRANQHRQSRGIQDSETDRPGAEKINPELNLVCKPLPQDDALQRQPLIALAEKEFCWATSMELEQGLEPTVASFKKRQLEA